MKLSGYEKVQLRKLIVAKLNNVPEGKRIHLNKELLDQLLFETIDGTTIKLPYWCGEFLSKIDLSEISFEDVSWNLLKPGNDIEKEELMPYINLLHGDIDLSVKYNEFIINSFVRNINDINNNFTEENYYLSDLKDDRVFYKNTNANIDFTKSFEAKNGLGICVSDCIFTGTDLSDLDISIFDRLDYVDLSNTGIKVSNMENFINGSFNYINLNNVDLSNITISYDLIRNIYDNGYIGIKDSKLNVISSQNKFDYNLNVDGFMDGCYFNGDLITSMKKSSSNFNDRRKEYEKMKAELFANIMQSIEEQKKSFRR